MIVSESTKEETFYLILWTSSNYTFVVHKNTYYKTGGQVQDVWGTESNAVSRPLDKGGARPSRPLDKGIGERAVSKKIFFGPSGLTLV